VGGFEPSAMGGVLWFVRIWDVVNPAKQECFSATLNHGEGGSFGPTKRILIEEPLRFSKALGFTYLCWDA
jgi:hypothetical protein